MEHLFIKQLQELEDDTITSFKTMLANNHIEELNEGLIFQQPTITNIFTKTSQALDSAYTISKKFLNENNVEVLAMTIDGDFICGNDQRTYCLPKNLLKSDMEIFDLPIRKFLLALDSEEVQSHILPEHLF